MDLNKYVFLTIIYVYISGKTKPAAKKPKGGAEKPNNKQLALTGKSKPASKKKPQQGNC